MKGEFFKKIYTPQTTARTWDSYGVKAMLISLRDRINLVTWCLHSSLNTASGQTEHIKGNVPYFFIGLTKNNQLAPYFSNQDLFLENLDYFLKDKNCAVC